MAERVVVSAPDAPKAIGPYSQAIKAGGFVFMSGQIPLDPTTGEIVAGGIEAETKQVLTNLAAVLTAAGSSFSKVVRATIYLVDLGDFAKVNAIYSPLFPVDPPARVTIQVAALPRGAMVEIEMVALTSD